MKSLVKTFIISITLLFTSTIIFAQQTTKQAKAAKKAAAITNKVEEKSYTFKADYAQPLRGGQRYLTSDYDLRVTKDSVIAFLPYFGRVYMSAPLTPQENGIMFTSTKFDYIMQPAKKSGWNITIVPANVKYISKMRLNIYPDGTATLLVSSNFRDQITFTGNIKE